MNLVLAQVAADRLDYFVTAPHEVPIIKQVIDGFGVEGDEFARIICVTDWMALWLVSGEASRHCCNSFSVYLQAVLIAISPERYGHIGLGGKSMPLFPPDNDPEHVADAMQFDQQVPSSLGEDAFKQAAALKPKQRRACLYAYLQHGVPR